MTKRKELTVLSVENWNEIPRNFSGKVFVARTSRHEWYVNGQLHRADGPAVEQSDGSSKWWYKLGKLHREDGPAYESLSGHKEWYLGEVHFPMWEMLNHLRHDYIVVERGIPTNVKFGKLKLTHAKLLTANGTVFVYDNLPGLEIAEGNQ